MLNQELIKALEIRVKEAETTTTRVEGHLKELRLADRLHDAEKQLVNVTQCCMALLDQVNLLTKIVVHKQDIPNLKGPGNKPIEIKFDDPEK